MSFLPRTRARGGIRSRQFEQLEGRHLLAVLPMLAADIDTVPVGSDPRHFFVHGDALYFSALAADLQGHELWRYDGQSVAQVDDINPTSRTADPKEFASFGGDLYFQADGSDDSPELWRFDGTTNSRVVDLNPGDDEEGSYPEDLTAFEDNLYFGARGPTAGTGLFRYDGTTVSPVPFGEDSLDNWGIASGLTVFQDTLYFQAYDDQGAGLFRLENGEAIRVAATAGFGTYAPDQEMAVFEDRLFFLVHSQTTGIELWSFDGTVAEEVADLRPGVIGAEPHDLTVFGDALYFSANDGVHDRELFRYDGESIEIVADIHPSNDSAPQDLIVYENQLYFSATDGVTGRELWRYDGETVQRVTDINPAGDSIVDGFAIFQGKLFFAAADTNTFDFDQNVEVWSFDGQTAELAVDVRPGNRSAYPQEVTSFQDQLYFGAYEAATGYELWSYNGLTASIVSDAAPGPAFSHPYALTTFQGDLYYRSYAPYDPQPTWRYDGQASEPLRDASGNPVLMWASDGVAVVDDALYYAANRTGSGAAPAGLWRWNGSVFQHIPLPSPLAGNVRSMAELDGALYLSQDRGVVWRYDGQSFTELDYFPIDVDLHDARLIDGLLYFTGEDPLAGRELWVSDFTPAGTRMAADLYAGPSNSNPHGFVAFEDAILFAAQSPLGAGDATREYLYRFDGQTATPVLDAPICNTSVSEFLAARDGVLYFAGRDAAHGCELWQYDGARSRIVADIAAGPLDSRPGHFQTIGDAFYFTADDIEHGNELWRLVSVPDGDFTGDGNVGLADLAVIQRNLGRAADAVYAQGDINGDGAVNAADIALLVARFGVSQPVASSSASAPSAIVAVRPRTRSPAAPADRLDAITRRAAARRGTGVGDATDVSTTSMLRASRRAGAPSDAVADAAFAETSFDVVQPRRASTRMLMRR